MKKGKLCPLGTLLNLSDTLVIIPTDSWPCISQWPCFPVGMLQYKLEVGKFDVGKIRSKHLLLFCFVLLREILAV